MVTSGIGGLCTESFHEQESVIQSVHESRHRRRQSAMLRHLQPFGTGKPPAVRAAELRKHGNESTTDRSDTSHPNDSLPTRGRLVCGGGDGSASFGVESRPTLSQVWK